MYDKKMLLSQRLANKNSDLMNIFFRLNKKLDNFVNYIEVDLNMGKLSSLLHKGNSDSAGYAHYAPLFADLFSDYNSSFSYRSTYDTIQGETKQYSGIMEGIEDVLDLIIDIDNALSDAKKMGKEEDNDDYIKFISNRIKDFRQYKVEFILLNDKVGMSLMDGNTVQDIDYRADDFFIPLEG